MSPVSAQSCTSYDTFTVSGASSGSYPPVTYGNVALRSGQRYKITVSGWWENDGTVNTYAGDYAFYGPSPSSGAYPWADFRAVTIVGIGSGTLSPSTSFYGTGLAAEADHEYEFDFWGQGVPLGIGIVLNHASWSFSFSICEYPLIYTPIYCTLVDYFAVSYAASADSGGWVVGNTTLVSGHSYYMWVVGETMGDATSDATRIDAEYFSYAPNWGAPTMYRSFQWEGTTTWASPDSTIYNAEHRYGYVLAGSGYPVMARVGGGWGQIRGGFEVYICDYSITPTPAPTYSPTPSSTPTPVISNTPRPTTESQGWFPTADSRPVCTGTPRPTRTPFMLRPSWTPRNTRTPSATPTGGSGDLFGESVDDPDPPEPTATWWPTALPTATSTPRDPGDCASPFGIGDTPIVDMNDPSTYERNPDGSVKEDCYTIFPQIYFSIDEDFRDFVNDVTGTETLTEANSTVDYPGLGICMRYYVVKLSLFGLDLTVFIAAIVGLRLFVWMIAMVRGEL